MEVKELIIDPGYNGTISLVGGGILPSPELKINTLFKIEGGVIDGTGVGELVVDDLNNTTAILGGGTLKDLKLVEVGVAGVNTTNWFGTDVENAKQFKIGNKAEVRLGLDNNRPTISNSTLVNEGEIDLRGTVYIATGLQSFIYNHGEFSLTKGDLRRETPAGAPPVTSFVNHHKVLYKNTATDTSIRIDLDFENKGSVEVTKADATLRFSYDGNHTGSFDVIAGSSISFDKSRVAVSGHHILQQGASLQGAGTYDVTRGSILEIPANVSISVANLTLNFDLDPDFDPITDITLNGTLTASNFEWQSGPITGNGYVNVPSTGLVKLTTDGEKHLKNGADFLIHGTLLWEEGNLALDNTSNITVDGSQSAGLFHVQQSNMAKKLYWKQPVNNQQKPTVIIQNNGLYLNGDPGLNIENVDLIPFLGRFTSTDINLTEALGSDNGILEFDLGAVWTIDKFFEQTGGSTKLNGGQLDVAEEVIQHSGDFYLDGGIVTTEQGITIEQNATLYGSGTLDGGSSGSNSVSLNGTVVVEIGGTAQGNEFDQIQSMTDVLLGGTLVINNPSGYQPTGAESYEILTFPQSSGTFSSVIGLDAFGPSSIYELEIEYNSTNVTLRVVEKASAYSSSISGRIWDDVNGNGIQEATETTGFAGVVIYLYDFTGTEVANFTTGSDGYYSFTGLAAGDYSIEVTMIPFDYEFTTQNAPGSNETNESDVDWSGWAYFTLGEDETKDDLDVGLRENPF